MAMNLKEQDAWLSTDIKAIKKDLKGIESSLRLNSKRINGHLLKDQGMRLKELAVISKNSQSSQGLRDTDGAVHTTMDPAPSKTDSQVEVDQEGLAKLNKTLKSVLRQAFREL